MNWRAGLKQKNVSPQREKDEQHTTDACSSSQPVYSKWRKHVDAGAQSKWGGYYFYFDEMERLECWPKLNGKTL